MSRNGLGRALQLLLCVFWSGFALASSFLKLPSTIVVPICIIQGKGFTSPYRGQRLVTQGVVTVDLDLAWQRGFYIQSDPCDSDPATSNGLFVYLAERIDWVSVGDRVQVAGEVDEYYGLTEILTARDDVRILSQGNPLPTATELYPPPANDAARLYFEAREGMLVHLDSGKVVGPTDSDDRTWLVRSDLGIDHIFYDDPAGTGQILCADDSGPFEVTPEVGTGAVVNNLGGVLEFRYGAYCLLLTNAPQVFPSSTLSSPLKGGFVETGFSFTVATYNLQNFFDTIDDPLTEDSVFSLAEYQRRLRKRALAIRDGLGVPLLLAVQEVENEVVLQDLVSHPEMGVDYAFAWLDGPDRRGLDVALLYQTGHTRLLGYEARQACTSLVDGLGPDGNLDMSAPANALTCDTDGDGQLDGNRLFSRPPLIVHMQICSRVGCPLAGEILDSWMIVSHWKSKVEDSDAQAYTFPRRLEQAQFTSALFNELRLGHPGAVFMALGDMNDHPDSAPVSLLSSTGLFNLAWQIPRPERYTLIYQGVAQTADYVLLSAPVGFSPVSVQAVHINADYPDSLSGQSDSLLRSSDHDPFWARLAILNHAHYLPLIRR